MWDEFDEPTPEQRTAFDKLALAIAEYHQAFDDPGMMMDWILVTHLTEPLADGRDRHATNYLGSDGTPKYRLLGLLDYAETVIKAQVGNDII